MTLQKPRMLLAPTAIVSNQAVFRRLQLILRNLPISDRSAPDLIQDMIRDFDRDGIELYRPEERVPYPLIDDAWDGDERYLRKFLTLDGCKYPERDKWLLLLVKIRYPHLYLHLLQ